jgi:hypothetical protein
MPRSPRKPSLDLAMLALVVVGTGGCLDKKGRPQMPGPTAEVQGGAEIAIRRGPDMGLSLKVKPPYAVGPFSSMTIRKGRISGVHCGGGFAVTATPDRISGHGPGGGTVEMEIWGDNTEVHAEGMWNGAYGKLDATPERLLVSLAMAPTVVQGGRVRHARYRTYTFRRGADGLFAGEFTGRPSLYETRPGATLVISQRIHALLTREELLAILMTLLAGAQQTGLPDPTGCGARG